MVVDIGSNTKDQFHQAGANLTELSSIVLSQLHLDHAAELPAILWPAGPTLSVTGPRGTDMFPALDDFLDSLFGDVVVLGIPGIRIQLTPITLDTWTVAAQEVWCDEDPVVTTRSLANGNVPTLAYRFDFGDTSITFTSDQIGPDASFSDFIPDLDALVIHMAVAENVVVVHSQLHAIPSVWGKMAAEALEAGLTIVRGNYTGEIRVGEDLLCVAL